MATTARYFRAGSAFAGAFRAPPAPTLAFTRQVGSRVTRRKDASRVRMVNTEEEYYKAIGKATVLVDAYAEWCHPCKVMSPVLDNIANVYRSVEFIKFDVDKLPKIAQELNIRAMPTFSIFKNGEFKEEFVGANPGKISKMIERHMDEKPEPW